MENCLQRLEKHLPALFQGQLQWLPWLYIAWNLLRTTPLFVFLLSYLPYRAWIFLGEKFRGRIQKPVVAVIKEGQKESEMTPETAKGFVNEMNRTTFQLQGWTESLGRPPPFKDWIIIKYGGYSYVTTVTSFAQLCLCKIAAKGLPNVIFVRNVTAVSANIGISERIAQSQACEMIFERTHHVEIVGTYKTDIPLAFQSRFEHVIPSWIAFAELRAGLWMGLAFVPAVLQAKNYSRLAVLASLIIITLDVSKHWIFLLYDWIFWKVSVFVKKKVFRGNKKCYSFFSAFSERWNCSNREAKKAYWLWTEEDEERGRTYTKIHFCKLKHLEDITFTAFLTHMPDAKNTFRCPWCRRRISEEDAGNCSANNTFRCPRCDFQIYEDGNCNWNRQAPCALWIYEEDDGNGRAVEESDGKRSRLPQHAFRVYEEDNGNCRAVAAVMPRNHKYAVATFHRPLFVE